MLEPARSEGLPAFLAADAWSEFRSMKEVATTTSDAMLLREPETCRWRHASTHCQRALSQEVHVSIGLGAMFSSYGRIVDNIRPRVLAIELGASESSA